MGTHEIIKRILNAKTTDVNRIEPLAGRKSLKSLKIITRLGSRKKCQSRESKSLISTLFCMENEQQLSILISLMNSMTICSTRNSFIEVLEEIRDCKIS